MNITIIATGKCKEKHINDQVDTFLKRLKPHFPTKLIEVPQAKGQTADEIKQKEAAAQLAKIPHGAIIVAMDERGELLSSMKFSQKLKKWRDTGNKNLVFIIGGAEGLDEQLRNQSQWMFSLSPLTFAHMMVRPILAEQLYRAASIIAGHPYHREG